MSIIVKVGKTGKRLLRRFLPSKTVPRLSYTRRIEQVRTDRRICAMTFDDGPMDMPAVPDRFGGLALTDVILDTLAEFDARGTFDVIGDTGENYPDRAGKLGSAAWGGIRFDHYPDLGCDSRGGAANNSRLIGRMLEEGHQITNHGYRHIIFGKKTLVYGGREYLGNLDLAVEDLRRLDDLMRENYGYAMSMHRPPHYVDRMQDGFTSYDVCDVMGYQYLAASFDGAGWLPSAIADPDAALAAEVKAMVAPLRHALEANPNALCGKIIFQKDGYNMDKRTPVAFGLREQLALLQRYGYRVVTVAELMAESPFSDVGRDDPDFERFCALAKARAVVYADNRLRPDAPMTWGELAMLLAPKEEAIARRHRMIRQRGKAVHPYAGAMAWGRENGLIPEGIRPDAPLTELPGEKFDTVFDFTRRSVYRAYREIK